MLLFVGCEEPKDVLIGTWLSKGTNTFNKIRFFDDGTVVYYSGDKVAARGVWKWVEKGKTLLLDAGDPVQVKVTVSNDNKLIFKNTTGEKLELTRI